MPDPRPYVINANVVNLLNSAPFRGMRPSLGSEIQRKTVDIGCYPFPFMVNEDNIPLDGRIINGVTTPVRPVPFWCSENSYADFYGDTTYNNGKIVWGPGGGSIRRLADSANKISESLENVFKYDAALGVTYPVFRASSTFLGLDNTVPQEWNTLKNAVFAGPTAIDEIQFQAGLTLEIANNILFKAWTGLSFTVREAGNDEADNTYGFVFMQEYNAQGGTFSPFFDRYNYGCLDQIFNSTRFENIAINPNDFWEGFGASYGQSGGMTGELFLLNAVTGGNNAGSYFVLSAGASNDALLQIYLLQGVSGGNTISGRDLAKNLYSVASDPPFIGSDDPPGGFIETMALLLGTNQKFATLATGGTASLRALDFNNPCSDSFQYDSSTVLGKWGYKVQKIAIGEDAFLPPPPPKIGCNRLDFVDYLGGPSAALDGIVHPSSWMFFRGASSGGAINEYTLAYMHDYVGNTTDADGFVSPVYNRLEGLHDYLCYEILTGATVDSRVYYPLNPLTKSWYDANVVDKFTDNTLPGYADAIGFGNTLDLKYNSAFSKKFRDQGENSSISEISLAYLDDNTFIDVQTEGASNLRGVTGILFPYFIPVATFAMNGIGGGGGEVDISGEFDKFEGWTKALFNVEGVTDPKKLYQYYADSISSGVSFGTNNPTEQENLPYTTGLLGQTPDFRLFSWNILNRIKPWLVVGGTATNTPVRSSFSSVGEDRFGVAIYDNNTSTTDILRLDGSQVNVDLLNYLPSALPDSPTRTNGLKYEFSVDGTPRQENLGCDSYINVARYANRVAPNDATGTVATPFPGLTATSQTIAEVGLSGSSKNLTEFEQPNAGRIEAPNQSNSFTRTGSVPNISTDFYNTEKNFFFTGTGEDPSLAVFGSSYYLTASEYYNKYVAGGETPNVNWWENVDNQSSIEIANQILTLLTDPDQNDYWAFPENTDKFRGSSYQETTDFNLGTAGIADALETYRLHPAFVYRLFTSSAMSDGAVEGGEDLGFPYFQCCARDWQIDGDGGKIPCHQYQPLVEIFYANFANYFNSGQTGCNSFGQEDVPDTDLEQKQYKDFFNRAKITGELPAVPPEPPKYAYNSGYFSPFFEDWDYQNTECGAGGSVIPDPPTGATLTEFGLKFAEGLNSLRTQKINIPNATSRQVRDDLFGFTGNTANGLPNGSNNNLGSNTVSVWLQSRLEGLLDYYNVNYANQDNAADIENIDEIFSTLYPTKFSAYKNSLSQRVLFRVRAIKPKCVEAWTTECSELAGKLLQASAPPSLRFASGFGSNDGFFYEEEVNGGLDEGQRIIARPSILELSGSPGNNSALTSNDIIPQNEGFLGAFRTVYIEPLGLAENVLATEAQAVPLATITSTVFGKITSVIDSDGIIRDVNLITFESGFGTKILGNNETGALTISVEGLTTGSLSDVGISGASSGDILVYDAELAKWVNRPFADVVQPFLAGFTGGVGGTNFFYQDSAPDAGITIGSRWMNSDTGIEYIYVNDGDSFQWIQSSVDVTAETPTFTYNTTLVTGSEYAAMEKDYYIGVSYAGSVLIQLPSEPAEGKTVIVKDASGLASYENRKITVVGATGSDTIDNEASAIINVNNGALQFIYKNGWRII